jgi:DNA helicase-2/ATP-dependent DNA helicase PcrA
MPDVLVANEAAQAAEEAMRHVYSAISSGESFVLEAGAGAGKTHSLITVLQHLIETHKAGLVRHQQAVACITYTNVAKDEIEARTDRDPTVYCDTIHGFCWTLIKRFQAQMRKRLPEMEKWAEKLQEAGGIGARSIDYSLGRRSVGADSVSIHHDDVISLFVYFVGFPKFRSIMVGRFPLLLIDEYQDMNNEFAEALKAHFLGVKGKFLIGFFGDHWQKIYTGVCGKIEHSGLVTINKGANFRSVRAVVDVLNRMRPELTQTVVDPHAIGSAGAYHTNDWTGVRMTGAQWKGDLPPEVKRRYVTALKERLVAEGWTFEPESTKILMLTHKALAAEQEYDGLASVFEYSSSYVDKEDAHIKFFADVLEPVCEAYREQHFGLMFSVLGGGVPAIRNNAEKREWAESMEKLLRLREVGTIGDVIDHLLSTEHPQLPEDLQEMDQERRHDAERAGAEASPSVVVLRALRDVRYMEVVKLVRYLDGHTPFSTKHGVKGAEFENVFVIVGMGWNRYNFNQMLELAGKPNNVPKDKQDAFERARNLFYVCCSRPKRRLAVLFTQQLSAQAQGTLKNWFGAAGVQSLGNL